MTLLFTKWGASECSVVLFFCLDFKPLMSIGDGYFSLMKIILNLCTFSETKKNVYISQSLVGCYWISYISESNFMSVEGFVLIRTLCVCVLHFPYPSLSLTSCHSLFVHFSLLWQTCITCQFLILPFFSSLFSIFSVTGFVFFLLCLSSLFAFPLCLC